MQQVNTVLHIIFHQNAHCCRSGPLFVDQFEVEMTAFDIDLDDLYGNPVAKFQDPVRSLADKPIACVVIQIIIVMQVFDMDKPFNDKALKLYKYAERRHSSDYPCKDITNMVR